MNVFKVIGVVTTVGVATTVGFASTVIITAYVTVKLTKAFDEFLDGALSTNKTTSNGSIPTNIEDDILPFNVSTEIKTASILSESKEDK